MTFKLDQITRSAEGREIRRKKEVPGERLTIGRASDSDVHLTDLAVALRHAVIQRVAALRLSVSAEEGLGVELNGRKVTSGFIELAQGGDIRIASHLLRFKPAAADADVIEVEVEKAGESAADEHSRIDANRFSLDAVMPGKRISAYVLIALVLGIFLAWPLYVYSKRSPADHEQIVAAQRSGTEPPQQASFQPDTMWSSGSLSQVHHNLEGQCSSCHVKAFEPVQDAACKNCHNKLSDHGDRDRPAAEMRARYNQSVPKVEGWEGVQLAVAERFGHEQGRCVDCHTEHEGPNEMILPAQFSCSSCHEKLKDRLPNTDLQNASTFGPRRGGPQQHPGFKPLVLMRWDGDDARAQFGRVPLGEARENSNLKFTHAQHMDPRGAVTRMTQQLGDRYGGRQQLTCSDCHNPTPDGARYQPVNMEEDCSSCHTLTFAVEDGLYRTLRHGAPDQVVADLREYFSGRVPARPAELGPLARRRPGDINQVRSALQYARARAGAGPAALTRIQSVFKQGGACFDCHQIEQRGSLDFNVRPVAFVDRYLLNGWFDHRAHTTMNFPGAGNHTGDTACLTCHGAEPNSMQPAPIRTNAAADLMLPGLESCQRCHVDEADRRANFVPSGCAMCHDYHMDAGAPASILRQRVRGTRWTTTVFPVNRSR